MRGFSGADGRELFELEREPSFGSCMAGIGDVDGDLVSDFAVGTHGQRGEVVVVSGASREIPTRIADDASQPLGSYPYLGGALVVLDDRDGDGVPDLGLSTSGRHFLRPGAGSVRIVSSRTGEELLRIADPLR